MAPLAQNLTFSKVLFGDFTESKSKDFSKDTIDDEESAEDYGYISDSDLEDDEDQRAAPFKHTTKSKVHPFDPFGIPGEDRRISSEEHEEHIEKGKVFKIPDIAFVTWVPGGILPNISLISSQVPGVSDVSLHEYDRVCTVWVRREPQVAER